MYPPAFDADDVGPVPTNKTPVADRVGRAPPLPRFSVATTPPTESVIASLAAFPKSQKWSRLGGPAVGAVVGAAVGSDVLGAAVGNAVLGAAVGAVNGSAIG